jgi:hypothetical protein
MAVFRQQEICKNCGQPYKAIHRKTQQLFVGDTFIRWDRDNHVCRIGTLFFIERTDTQNWYNKKGWTIDPMKAVAFKTKQLADNYLKMSLDIPARLHCVVTEHYFVLPPESKSDKKQDNTSESA